MAGDELNELDDEADHEAEDEDKTEDDDGTPTVRPMNHDPMAGYETRG